MAKKKKVKQETSQPQPFREARRKALAIECEGTANVLTNIAEGNFETGMQPDYNAFDARELKQIETARDEILMAARRLRAVRKNIQREQRDS